MKKSTQYIIGGIGAAIVGLFGYFAYNQFVKKSGVSPTSPVVIPTTGSFTLEWTNPPFAVSATKELYGSMTIDNEQNQDYNGFFVAGLEDIKGNDLGPIIVRPINIKIGEQKLEGVNWPITQEIASLSEVRMYAYVYNDAALTDKKTGPITWTINLT